MNKDIKILNFGEGKYQYYKENVQGNENVTFEEAQKKMTRNMLLAKKADSTGYYGQMYQYGSLWFVVNRRNKIVWIKNYCWIPKDWELDKHKYIELNKKLGIEDKSSVLSLTVKESKYKYKKLIRKIISKFINNKKQLN